MDVTENANSDSGTESTEEDIEPKFKYQRIGNDLKTILKTDVVTCSAVHPKFLIFGTFLGRVYLLDHEGNSVASNLNVSNCIEFQHSVAVNHVDLDERGEYVATCSDDGKVNVTGLFSNENNQNLSLGKSIKAVCLDPDPKAVPGKRFIVGDDKLTMYEKNFLKKLKNTQLSSAEGYVLSVCWSGSFVAWASHLGVRVYDLNEKCSLGLMKWEEPNNARLENFRCNFRWSNATTLLIGWVDTVRICVIRKRNSIEVASRNLPDFIVDPISTFQTKFYICGLAPLTNTQIVVLGYPKEKDDDRKALRPVLCVMEYKMNSSEEICTDSLSLRGYQEYTVNDYSLGCIIEENRYFIVAPKDIVVASPLDTDDRVKWLIDHRKFDEAMDVIRTTHDSTYKLFYVASLYVDHLLAQKQFDAAAKLCLLECGKDRQLWQAMGHKFNKCGQLRSISAYLPTAEDCKLEPQFYEIVLHEYLRYDTLGFLNLIREWPSYLYDCQSIIKAVEFNFRSENAKILSEALAILYTHQQDYENALRIYFKLQNKDVFDLISRYKLFGVIHNIIKPLIDLDRERAFKILLNKDNILPEIVVKKLKDHQEYLYWYLHELDRKGLNNNDEFHRMLVKLYARFDRSKLLPFLQRSKRYDIQQALEICRRELFYREMVYLLGVQLGNTTEALNIIIHNINDIEMAIEFCKERDDLDLWNVLIDESVNNPQILTKLLDSIIGYVNPEAVVQKIKLGQKIPGLRKSVVKMLMDYRLQVSIQRSSNNIQNTDYFNLHSEVVHKQRRGLSVSHDITCEQCNRSIIAGSAIQPYDVTVFFCGHAYHTKCLPANMNCRCVGTIAADDEG